MSDKKLDRVLDKARDDRDVLAVVNYGSLARGEPHRDIDVCLVLNPGEYSELSLSNKKLEYLAESSEDVDVQVFQQLPLYIKQRILKEGRILYCRDEDLLYGLSIGFVKEFEDYKPVYRRYLEAVANA